MNKITRTEFTSFLQNSSPVIPHDDVSSAIFHASFQAGFDHPWFKGHIHNISLRHGFSINLADAHIHSDFTMESFYPADVVAFTFCTEGDGTFSFDNMSSPEDYEAGSSIIYCSPGTLGEHFYCAGHRYRAISVYIQREMLLDFIGNDAGNLHPGFFDKLRQPAGFYFDCIHDLHHLIPLISSIFECPYSGLSKRFFIESKVLEFIAERISYLKPEQAVSAMISEEDVQKIAGCKLILERDFRDPPSLMELAREAGLNMFKLKTGFRELYKTSPYQFLKEFRMQKAWELLTTQKVPVNEVADQVGYSSLGSFSNAFVEKFGIRPSTVLKTKIPPR